MNALPHSSAETADLLSIDGRDRVRFEFSPLRQAEHVGWITYRIEWSQVDPTRTCLLADTAEPTLFLNVEPINEIQILTDGIRGLLRGDDRLLRFEPMDEGEFLLEVSSHDGRFGVRCHPRPIVCEMRWFDGVEVTAAALEAFVDRLGAIQLSSR